MGNPESGSDLESVANLVRLSETAPMPRIDGSEPPPLVRRPRADSTDDPASAAFGGVLDVSTGSPVEQLAKRGPVPLAEPPAPPAETAPPPQRRPARYGVFAGAAVLVCAGLGSWALWPSASGGTDSQPVEPPPAPVHTSSAPPAVSTLSASPAPATGQVRDTVVRASSRPATTAPPPRVQPTQKPEQESGNQPHDSWDDTFRSAVSSYLEEWGGGDQAPRRWHG
ncbi:hypothetical protein ATK30_8493 [Amycolatopsis echigonensis]|uniref:Uncharacterized protein n=1 Tax=Amycolatopsis echigonensis TaxID=2576905 RepID=A0A2N3WUG1_9PSEU|nr:hypothetical protein [Amycolatopsis niigatensis]PKV97511.1 hypothetical protein ATK30_8493 [Amycolatopsis niigatensis]